MELGRKTVDAILERTNEGRDKNGNQFKGYSKAYIESDIFKIYGKSRGRVNLKLTGDMQAAVDVVKITPRGFEIGFVDIAEEEKATGHVRGSNHLPVRDFWGLPSKETLRELIQQTVSETVAGTQEIVESLAGLPIEAEVGEQSLLLDFALLGNQ